MKEELFESILEEGRSSLGAYEGSVLLNPVAQKPTKRNDTYAIHNKIVDAFDDLYEAADSPKEFATIVTDALSNSDVSDDEIKALANELKEYI